MQYYLTVNLMVVNYSNKPKFCGIWKFLNYDNSRTTEHRTIF